MEVLKRLEGIFRDIFDDESLSITRETTPDDIEEWDSLAQINIIVNCESEFGIKFDLNDISGIGCVGDLADIISGKEY